MRPRLLRQTHAAPAHDRPSDPRVSFSSGSGFPLSPPEHCSRPGERQTGYRTEHPHWGVMNTLSLLSRHRSVPRTGCGLPAHRPYASAPPVGNVRWHRTFEGCRLQDVIHYPSARCDTQRVTATSAHPRLGLDVAVSVDVGRNAWAERVEPPPGRRTRPAARRHLPGLRRAGSILGAPRCPRRGGSAAADTSIGHRTQLTHYVRRGGRGITRKPLPRLQIAHDFLNEVFNRQNPHTPRRAILHHRHRGP